MGLAVAVTALGSSRTVAVTKDDDTLTLAVYGDAPYGTSDSDTAQFQATRLVDTVNADLDVSLVLHVGDIHGQARCSTSPPW